MKLTTTWRLNFKFMKLKCQNYSNVFLCSLKKSENLFNRRIIRKLSQYFIHLEKYKKYIFSLHIKEYCYIFNKNLKIISLKYRFRQVINKHYSIYIQSLLLGKCINIRCASAAIYYPVWYLSCLSSQCYP